MSFVDCPGHETFMAAMLNGAAVMDAALLIIGKKMRRKKTGHFLGSKILAADQTCPQPQTSEHLAAIDIMKLNSIIILQNKIDLVGQAQAEDQYKQIVDFIQG